jgi:hypothetical protein
MEGKPDIIIYNTPDGKASVALYAKDGNVWMNQNQLAELFDTSKQNIDQHIKSILEDRELDVDSVVKNYFTTATNGKKYKVAFYSFISWPVVHRLRLVEAILKMCVCHRP